MKKNINKLCDDLLYKILDKEIGGSKMNDKFKLNILNNVSIIEDSLADIHDQNNLIDLMINEYFSKGELNDVDKMKVEMEYKYYQSLVFTVSRILKNVEKNLKLSINRIYDECKQYVCDKTDYSYKEDK